MLSSIPSTIATVTDNEKWISPVLKTDFCNKQMQNAVKCLLINLLNKAESPGNDKIKGTSYKLRY